MVAIIFSPNVLYFRKNVQRVIWARIYPLQLIQQLLDNRQQLRQVQSTKTLLLPPKYKINIYSAIQSFIFPILRILDFFLLLIVKLSLFILFASFLVSVHDSDSCQSFTLLKAKRLPLFFANAFKRVKERQLLLSQ